MQLTERTLMQNEAEFALPSCEERPLLRLSPYRIYWKTIGWLKRFRHWEFWPPYLFYPPVIAYIVYLGIKFKSLTLFTTANPSIPAGGFVGESKQAILNHLKNGGGAQSDASWLPDSLLILESDPSSRLQNALSFIESKRLDFPIVLKPDAGQRGSGVVIIRSHPQLEEYLFSSSFPVIVQEYVSGREFGVFYYRYPGDERGRIFSVTEKRMPVLIGDGRHTLEKLILEDDRAVCMADFYLRKNATKVMQIPRAGDEVALVEIGTHCRGAIFLDGNYTITPSLEKAIQRIADRFEGFFFGRFDIRVPSVDDLMKGQNLKVLELNGVTSEATHIYDPKLSLIDAYRVLLRQWRIAFEIGNLNRAAGVRPNSIVELIRMALDYRRLAQQHPE